MVESPRWHDKSVAELVSAVRDGNEQAFVELRRRYEPRVHKKCLDTLYGDRAAAEDAVAETFLIVWKDKLSTLSEPSSLLSWLLTVARRQAFRQIPKAIPTEKMPEPPADHPSMQKDTRHLWNPESDKDASYYQQLLANARAALSKEDDDLLEDFQLIIHKDATLQDIAKKRGKNPGALYASFFRLRKNFRAGIIFTQWLKTGITCPGMTAVVENHRDSTRPVRFTAMRGHLKKCPACQVNFKRDEEIVGKKYSAIPFLFFPAGLAEQLWKRTSGEQASKHFRRMHRPLQYSVAVASVLAIGLFIPATAPPRQSQMVAAATIPLLPQVSPPAEFTAPTIPAPGTSAIPPSGTSTAPTPSNKAPHTPEKPSMPISTPALKSAPDHAPKISVPPVADVTSARVLPAPDITGPAFKLPANPFSSTALAQTRGQMACGSMLAGAAGPPSHPSRNIPFTVTVTVQAHDPSGVAGITLTGIIGKHVRSWPMKATGKPGTWTASISYTTHDYTGPSGTVSVTATAVDKRSNKSVTKVGQLQLHSCPNT